MKPMIRWLLSSWPIVLIVLLASCSAEVSKKPPKVQPGPDVLISEVADYTQPMRPALHFSAPENPIKSLDGLIYDQGVYHLYYREMDNDSIRHVTTKDLVFWMPSTISVPSGIKFLHVFNSSVGMTGYGAEVFLALADSVQAENGLSLKLLISRDQGRVWEVLEDELLFDRPLPTDARPTLAVVGQKWVMSVVIDDQVRFYESVDLITWNWISDYGSVHGNHESEWSQAQLVFFGADGDRELWALLIKMKEPVRGSKVQYFLGDFNGQEFVNGHPIEKTLWLETGSQDMVISSGLHGIRSVYVTLVETGQPNVPWQTILSQPRTMEVFIELTGRRVKSYPASEINQQRRVSNPLSRTVVSGYQDWSALLGSNGLLDFEILVTKTQRVNSWRIYLQNGDREELIVGYSSLQNIFYAARGDSANALPQQIGDMPIQSVRINKHVQIAVRMILDKSTLEVYNDLGEVVFTIPFDIQSQWQTLYFETPDGAVVVEGMIYELASVW